MKNNCEQADAPSPRCAACLKSEFDQTQNRIESPKVFMNSKYNFRLSVPAMVCLLLAAAVSVFAAAEFDELKPERIAEIEAMLPEQPAGFGRPASDREFWTNAQTRAIAGSAVADAEKLLGQKFPAWSDDLYLDFSRTGTRPPGERMLKARRSWLKPLVAAECLENQGRFLPLLNRILREFADEPTWTLPAHDGNLDNFHRKKYFVDLDASSFGAELAQAIYLLGDRLDPDVRQQVIAAIEKRIFVPIRHTLLTGKGTYWLGSENSPVQNNWNAVCLAGVVGAARTLLPDRHDRAVFIAAGEHYSNYFINGFRDDGYCDEGAGYWAYGFGNYVILREVLADATGGHIDLFANPKIQNIAMYGERIQLLEHMAPPFADCRFGTKADEGLIGYCKRVLKLGDCGDNQTPLVCKEKLTAQFMTATSCAGATNYVAKSDESVALRSFFDQAGVLVCRPRNGTTNRLSAAIKAGGNSSHSHNDIGSFVIASGNQEMVGDPGGPHAYNNKVFGPERYTYKILNSFGHPVPVVAGQLQLDATKIHPKVLATHFTEEQDEIKIDLKPAYDVPSLEKLTRTMRFSRSGAGMVEIEDTVVFKRPMTFELALPNFGSYKQIDNQTVEFDFVGEKIQATIKTPDGFNLTTQRIQELDAPAFIRLGIKLRKPVTAATVKVDFTPVLN